MIGLKLGTLIRMRVNIDLLDGCSVSIGDLGIIVSTNPGFEYSIGTEYDYQILINGCKIMVFDKEIEQATYLLQESK